MGKDEYTATSNATCSVRAGTHGNTVTKNETHDVRPGTGGCNTSYVICSVRSGTDGYKLVGFCYQHKSVCNLCVIQVCHMWTSKRTNGVNLSRLLRKSSCLTLYNYSRASIIRISAASSLSPSLLGASVAVPID